MALFQNSFLNKYIKLQDRETIDKTNVKIDQLVYELYALSEYEIKIVEENV
jgi:hypothetical protein